MRQQDNHYGTVRGRTAGDVGTNITALFGERGRIGTTAEQASAKLLWQLGQQHEELFTLHGVKLPGFNWDIDHLVIYRDLMVIIDDKAWRSNADYYFKRDPRDADNVHVLRDGAEFDGNTLHPTYYQRILAQFFPRKKVLSVIVMHGHDQRFTWANTRSHIPVITAAELEPWLERQFQAHATKRRMPATKQFYLFGQFIPYTREIGQLMLSPTDLMFLFRDQHSRGSAMRATRRMLGQGEQISVLKRVLTAIGLVVLLGLGLPFGYVVAMALVQLFSGNY